MLRTKSPRALVAGLAGALTAVVALSGPASAAPAPRKYSGTTSEKGTVTFVLASNRKSVLGFTAQDGYNEACHFSGGFGGVKTFTVTIARMAVTAKGTFTGTQSQSNKPFRGSTVLVVKGKLMGSSATGTVDALNHPCGTGSPTPKASFYLESFTASAH